MTDAPERIWLIKDPHTPSPWVSERGEVWANDPICLGEYIRADLLDAAVNEALDRAKREARVEMFEQIWAAIERLHVEATAVDALNAIAPIIRALIEAERGKP